MPEIEILQSAGTFLIHYYTQTCHYIYYREQAINYVYVLKKNL